MTVLITHAFVSAKPQGADSTKVSHDPWNAPHVLSGPIISVSPYFNAGVDGALNFDGTATVLGMAPATVNGFKVYTLTRCIYGTTIAIGTGVKIFAANWRVFASVSIIGAGSTLSFIHNDGNAAPASTAGGSIIDGTATAAGYFAATIAGTSSILAGMPAPFCTSAAAAAAGLGDATHHDDGHTPTVPCMGGGGGGVSTGSSGASGAQGGAMTVSNPNVGFAIAEQLGCKLSIATAGGRGTATAFGTVINLNPCGGGAGASAGALLVSAPLIQGIGLSCNGGRGGDGANGTWTSGTDHGDCASGGGGGGGGLCMVIYATRTDAPATANGGGGGTGVAFNTVSHSQTCVAGNGGAGSAGRVLLYNISGDGT